MNRKEKLNGALGESASAATTRASALRLPTISQAFRCLDEVARRGSVRQAAPAMHLSAAAVNQQILKLEERVGARLFNRLPRGMQLTSAGEIVLAAVRRSQRDLESALTQVGHLESLQRGHISLGVSHSSAENLMPSVLQKMLTDYPGLSFKVRCGTGEELLRWTASGEVDAAYCLRSRAPAGIDELHHWPQRLGVVVAPGHPLTQRRLLRMADCLDYPMVLMGTEMELRAMVERLDARILRQGRPLLETTSIPLARQIVASSGAISFLIPENVLSEVAHGHLIWRPLEDANALAHSCLYVRTGFETNQAMQALTEALDRAIGAMARQVDTANAVPFSGIAV